MKVKKGNMESSEKIVQDNGKRVESVYEVQINIWTIPVKQKERE